MTAAQSGAELHENYGSKKNTGFHWINSLMIGIDR
jgi:hypothetical protein